MGLFGNTFSLSTSAKVGFVLTGAAALLFGIGYALRPVADIIDDIDDDSSDSSDSSSDSSDTEILEKVADEKKVE